MNFDALIAPISERAPCGDDLSFSAEFDTIQECRRADDPTLNQGEWVTSLKLADWPAVGARCADVLARRSKDLRIAAWLTDAEARLRGYAGLADGLTLCGLLCEHYWEALHPQLDDGGDTEQRSGNLRWLLQQTTALVPTLPVLQGRGRAFSLLDIDTSRAFVGAGERSDDAAPAPSPATSRVTPEQIAAARQSTPHAFIANLLADARRAQQALAELQRILDTRLGEDGPTFLAAKSALDDAIHAIERLARETHPHGNATGLPGGADAGPTANAAPGAAATPGAPRSRSDALRHLRAVAEFFRRTEPHSPVAYLAERAAQWGEMPLHAWLRAVVKDPGTLSQVEELLGVDPPRAD